jgi:hypothetical protein
MAGAAAGAYRIQGLSAFQQMNAVKEGGFFVLTGHAGYLV